jgi:anti-sigma B factor antagonist
MPERRVLIGDMPEAKILLSREGKVARFKIVGVGTFQSAVGFKATYMDLLADGVTDYVVDLGECDILDSTFLGTILGLALKVRALPAGHVYVVKPNETVKSLFRGTGLDQIFDMWEPGEG